MIEDDGGVDNGGEQARGGDEPHVAPLDSHLRGHLELQGAGTVDVEVLFDTWFGVTELYENIYNCLHRQWSKVELPRRYALRRDVVGADDRVSVQRL